MFCIGWGRSRGCVRGPQPAPGSPPGSPPGAQGASQGASQGAQGPQGAQGSQGAQPSVLSVLLSLSSRSPGPAPEDSGRCVLRLLAAQPSPGRRGSPRQARFAFAGPAVDSIGPGRGDAGRGGQAVHVAFISENRQARCLVLGERGSTERAVTLAFAHLRHFRVSRHRLARPPRSGAPWGWDPPHFPTTDAVILSCGRLGDVLPEVLAEVLCAYRTGGGATAVWR